MSKYSISVLLFLIIETLLAVLCFMGIINVYHVIITAVFYISLLSYSSFSISSSFYFPVICRGAGGRKEIALTFDDGPLEKYTPEILDILKAKSVTAAFFCTGKALQLSRDIAQRIADEGHIIGNHTWTHSSLFDFYSAEKMSSEISGTNELIKSIAGKSPRFFRPPFGVTNPHLSKALKNSGLITIGWTFRTFDTVIKDRRKLIDRTIGRLTDGAILTFHDYSKAAVDILPELIDSIRNKGYTVVSLYGLIEEKPYE